MKWFLLFLILPILEVFIFLKVNEIFGIIYTLSMIIFTACLGTFFVKSQGVQMIQNLTDKKNNPLLLISHGLILLIAGILLLTPGFITDTIGFFLLSQTIRKFIIIQISKRIHGN